VNGTKGYHFQPRRGNLAAWWSCYTNGTQDFSSSHESTPVLEGIKWNAARFFYDNVDKCSSPAATSIRAPVAARSLEDRGHSNNVMFGSTFPQGVWTSPEGTNHAGGKARNPYHTEEKNKDLTKAYIDLARKNPVEVAQKRIARLKLEL